MKKFFYALIPFLALASILGLYKFFKPIPFLFATGLVLMFLFYLLVKYSWEKDDLNASLTSKRSSILSALIFITLFILSLITLKDYLLPHKNQPYFNNTDHYIIRNYGIGFRTPLYLYKEAIDSSIGLMECNRGSVIIERNDGDNFVLRTENYFVPLFSDKHSGPLNPLFNEYISPGTSIANSKNKLEIIVLRSWRKDNIPIFALTLVYHSSDSMLLGSFYQEENEFIDTLVIEKITVRKGLDLKNILLSAEPNSVPGKREKVFRWLEHYSGIEILTTNNKTEAEPRLNIFPGEDFFRDGEVTIGNRKLQPTARRTITIDPSAKYYCGLGNNDQAFSVKHQGLREKFLNDTTLSILEFNSMTNLPLTQTPEGTASTGNAEIRFLKNVYAQLEVNEIRRGFLFHDKMKNNRFTRFNGLLEYQVDNTGIPLQWKVFSMGQNDNIAADKDHFSLKSENGSLNWLFEFEDLSQNKFHFSYLKWYLFVLTLIMLLLTTITPSKKLVFIETPVLIVVYLLFVYRMLLLWRVATFPPLENISLKEYNEVREFDILGWVGIPISWVVTCILLIAVFAYRFIISENKQIKLDALLKKFRLNPLFIHLIILVGCTVVLYVLSSIEWLKRISTIIVPLLSYFYFVKQVINKPYVFNYTEPKIKNRFILYLFRMLANWINSPVFFLSLFTLLFLGWWDTGFGVLFLSFLVVKSIFFNFGIRLHNPPKRFSKELTEPNYYRVYGVMALAGLIIVLSYQKSIALLLLNKNQLIVTSLIFLVLTVFFLTIPYKKHGKKNWGQPTLLVISILLLVSYAFNIKGFKTWTETSIDNKIRHVVYRSTILFQPLEKMLFDYEYNSGKERKIIETAQNQWFINSYLAKEKTDFIQAKKINFRPHFNTGVSYITQTRDVVLSRYVIAEFGGLTMFLLVLLFFVPVVIYLRSYRLGSNSVFYASSYAGALPLVLLFVIALFVWLSSTNRFVFFGQDFPFLSLTSKVSTLLPILLIVFLLFQKPVPFLEPGMRGKVSWMGILLFVLIIGGIIIYEGKSNLLKEDKFKVNFSVVENRIEEVNTILKNIQTGNKKIKESDLQNPDILNGKVADFFDLLYKDQGFLQTLESCTPYEKSMLQALKNNPGTGFSISNPVHIKYDDEIFKLVFNPYFRLELPPYDIKNVWKGDIVQEPLGLDYIDNEPRLLRQRNGQAELLIIPARYFPPGMGTKGILNHTSTRPGQHLQSYVYHGMDKSWQKVTRDNFAAVIDSTDLIFLTNPSGGYQGNWSINSYTRPYFSYSFQINGRQRHIFPLGKSLYWSRHYNLSSQLHFEKLKDYHSNNTLTLDYNLNRDVNNYLQSLLSRYKQDLPEMSFSVIAADGNGRLRLMADFDMNREIIDPNDEQQISKKQKEQYFIVNNEAERKQWGNINLLRMKNGPGSSIKPIVVAAVTSQLKLEWNEMEYQSYNGFNRDSKGGLEINRYGGLSLGTGPWNMSGGNNIPSGFTQYIQTSHNMYHTLIMFLSSYPKNRFVNNDGYASLKNVLRTVPADSLSVYPQITFRGDKKTYYLPPLSDWPTTTGIEVLNEAPTYFGNTESLLARGMAVNFDLFCDYTNKKALTNQKYNFTTSLSDSVLNKNVWSFPEESYFLQSERTDNDRYTNFNVGLRSPTLGGTPYQLTPYKMLSMLGKMVKTDYRYKILVNTGNNNSTAAPDWKIDPGNSWGGLDNYQSFLENSIFKGMSDVLRRPGTAWRLNNNSNILKGYHLYAKTGTIDGSTKEENSKRLAVIISKEPLRLGIESQVRFYVVYFTVGNAYREDDSSKNWYWEHYAYILNQIIDSESFREYMK